MIDHTPDLDSLIDERVHGAERHRFARVHEALVRAGPLSELPETLVCPPAVARPCRPTRPDQDFEGYCRFGSQSDGGSDAYLGR